MRVGAASAPAKRPIVFRDEVDRSIQRWYLKLTDVGPDLQFLASSGWQVASFEFPDDAAWLPIWLLRVFSKRHRYRVTYVRDASYEPAKGKASMWPSCHPSWPPKVHLSEIDDQAACCNHLYIR